MAIMHPDSSILKEADKLVYGDRNSAYGHPYDDYKTTSELWNAILGDKLNGPITPYDASLMMIAMKISRASHKYKRDNLVDIAGYAAVAEEIQQAEDKPAPDESYGFKFGDTVRWEIEEGVYRNGIVHDYRPELSMLVVRMTDVIGDQVGRTWAIDSRKARKVK